jgi:hypothetical protein
MQLTGPVSRLKMFCHTDGEKAGMNVFGGMMGIIGGGIMGGGMMSGMMGMGGGKIGFGGDYRI